MRRRRCLVVLAALAAMTVLRPLGAGAPHAPPVHSWAAMSEWYESVPPEHAVMAMVRAAALVLAGWLALATMLQLIGAVPALRPIGRLADHISPRSLQRLGHGLAGLSLTAGLTAVVPSAGIPLVDAATRAPTARVDAGLPKPPPADAPGTASIRVVDQPTPAPEPTPGDQVTVVVGDSLWSIAEEAIAERTGTRPTDREIAPYWRRLIDLNRSNLVDPGNPDLIFPGQVFALPSS